VQVYSAARQQRLVAAKRRHKIQQALVDKQLNRPAYLVDRWRQLSKQTGHRYSAQGYQQQLQEVTQGFLAVLQLPQRKRLNQQDSSAVWQRPQHKRLNRQGSSAVLQQRPQRKRLNRQGSSAVLQRPQRKHLIQLAFLVAQWHLGVDHRHLVESQF
jgi:hypothetical protein